MEKPSAVMENYLKTIYFMCCDNTLIHVTDIAIRMKLSKASVCRATYFLSEKGLVNKNRYHGLTLTPKGLKQAKLLSKRYNIIQTFLNKVLGVDLPIATEDACNFEHTISLESLQAMQRYLVTYETGANTKARKVSN